MVGRQQIFAQDFDRLSRAYDQLWSARLHDRLLLGALPPHPGLVVEVGCGSGALARQLARRAERVLACDISPRMLQVARECEVVGNLEYALLPLERLGERVGTGTCDAIVAERVLHHCDDLPAAVATLVSCLAPGGHLIVLDLKRTGMGQPRWLRQVRNTLFEASVLAEAALAGRFREAWRGLRRDRQTYRHPAWQSHLAHEPEFDWRSLRDVMRQCGLDVHRRSVHSRFGLVIGSRP